MATLRSVSLHFPRTACIQVFKSTLHEKNFAWYVYRIVGYWIISVFNLAPFPSRVQVLWLWRWAWLWQCLYQDHHTTPMSNLLPYDFCLLSRLFFWGGGGRLPGEERRESWEPMWCNGLSVGSCSYPHSAMEAPWLTLDHRVAVRIKIKGQGIMSLATLCPCWVEW